MKAFVTVLAFCALLPLAQAAEAPPKPVPAHTPEESKELFAEWNKILKPLSGKTEVFGHYGGGCIVGAETLPMDGKNFSVVRAARHRYFGHPNLIKFIDNLANQMKARKMPRLLVGDLGRPRGGPMISGHASHQIGLDVDLWFRMSKRKPTKKEREEWGSPSLVKNNRYVTKGWTNDHRRLVMLSAEAPEVERVFVNAGIKKDLCEKFRDAPWQYKVRAWWGHDDHVHVRLFCPEGSPNCQKQEPLDPKNNQCGAELAWWFSEEAVAEGAAKKDQIAQRGFPALPKECERMVDDVKVAHKGE